MKGRQIVLGAYKGREAAALLVDGHLEDLLIASDAPPPGTIYRARADRPVKGQGGLFFKTPDGSGYLRGVKNIAPGQSVLVQVAGYAEPGKAIPMQQKVLFKSRYAIVTPEAPGLNVSRRIKHEDTRDALLECAYDAMQGSEMGLILRSSAETADLEAVSEDIAAMRSIAEQIMADATDDPALLLEGDGPHDLAGREWTAPADIVSDETSFDDLDITSLIEDALAAEVALSAEASAFVEPTRALVAIDVNTGADGSFASGLKANLSLARMLPRILRVRGLGGQIVLDLAPMPKKERRGFENALRAAFRHDDVETVLAGWTPLGHYELQRKRSRQPLQEILS